MTTAAPRPRWYDRVGRWLIAPRIRFVSAAMLVLMGGLWIVSIVRGAPGRDAFGELLMPDLLAHLAGGRLVVTGRADHLYEIAAQREAADAIIADRDLHLFLSPPFVAWIYAPFALVSYRVALVAWMGALVAQLGVAGLILRSWTRDAWTPGDRRMALLVALASAPMLDLFGSGQDTGISVLLWVAGASLTARRRDVPAGFVWALGWFKPQLFIAVPFVLVGLRRWKTLGAYALGSLAIAALTVATAGIAGVRAWRALLGSPTYSRWILGVIGWKMQSLPALLRALLPSTLQGVATVVGTLAGITLAIAAIARTARTLPRDRTLEPGDEMRLWALVCLATLIASPHLFLYDLVLAAFPCVIVLQRADARSRALVALLVLISWTTGIRGLAFGGSAWPVRALAAGFSVIPLVALALRWPAISATTPASVSARDA